MKCILEVALRTTLNVSYSQISTAFHTIIFLLSFSLLQITSHDIQINMRDQLFNRLKGDYHFLDHVILFGSQYFQF
jgi:ribosome-associated toxin RatA of RatAB toxin-antitoxin module